MMFTTHSQACANRPVYKVGIGSQWPPFVMYNPTPYGIDIEVTKSVFANANLCIEFIQLPSSARGITELEKGLIDILPSASFSVERAKVAYFSAPYRRERMRLFSNREIGPNSSLIELFSSGHTFTSNPGAYYGEELKQIKKIEWYDKRLFEISSLERRVEMVAKGRVDFLIEDEDAGYYYINQLGYHSLVLHPYVVNDNAIHFMLGRHAFNRSEIDRINTAIKSLSETISDISKKYRKDSE
ncbi:transporter substrate-binding domain-containing protein [Pseudoalteromonas sp. McH1-7]|nr:MULTISPECIES: transporter substrate-binding domain-containing protein [Pseudoalteromonas]MDW7548686.1 transporter substrate-binding domain-containing protein [Pseudoalteromonas peptidolytica]NLR16811.1 amino acid ABC transporter substrate-binding protein [Pseudoalteromonas peptidolytica]NUZ10273.1 transporter substrate-binding domain-containing protein [Pseudoalteromonas sp. McH1-7]RXF03128.1 amino acid ABC transporter substrate-binding protein [Pseudoalteromonas sp. PS5]USD30582.1 transpor